MSDSSFTDRVVAELAPHAPVLACCRRSLLQGMLLVSDRRDTIRTTRLVAARAAMQALHSDSLAAHVTRAASPRRARYVVEGEIPAATDALSGQLCCTKSRLRGAFMSTGRLQRPDAGPYLEIGCASSEAADTLLHDARVLGVDARVRSRRTGWLVIVRSAAAVANMLSSIGAQSGRLDFEGGRVVRDVRSTVNRRLNAETANLLRTARAGVVQVAAASALEADASRWSTLAPALREAALLRSRHPQEDLAALAQRARCSRSAMAGRLRRLVALADTA